jgi:transposase
MNNQDGRKRSRQTLEAFRITAVKRVLAGETPKSVMDGSGLHQSNIYSWLRQYQKHGVAGLQTRKAPGRAPALGEKYEHILLDQVVDVFPVLTVTQRGGWTREQVLSLVEQHTGKTISTPAITRLLKQFAVQHMRPFAYLQKIYAAETTDWLTLKFQALKKEARRKDAVLYFCSYSTCSVAGCVISNLSVVTPKGQRRFILSRTPPSFTHLKDGLLHLLSNEEKNIILLMAAPSLSPMFTPETVNQLPGIANRIISVTALPDPSTKNENTRVGMEVEQPNKHNTIAINDSVHHVDQHQLAALIHESVLEPLPWYSFINKINALLDCRATISVNIHLWNNIIRPDMNLDTLDEFCEIAQRVWPSYLLKEHLKKPGDLASLTEIYSPAQLEKNDYYKHYLQGFHHACYELAFYISGDTTAPRTISLTRSASQGPFGEHEKTLLQNLLPQLQVGMKTYIRLRQSELSLKALHDAANHLEVATLILDGTGSVINGNKRALDLLKDRTALRLHNHRITFNSRTDTKMLAQYVEQAIAWRIDPDSNKPLKALRVEYKPDQYLGVLVQPIEIVSLGEPAYVTSINPHAIIHINDPANSRPKLDEHLIALSIQEARLATILASGSSTEQAAQLMNITLTTARTYLQRVYQKLAVNRQADLVQLISKSVASL